MPTVLREKAMPRTATEVGGGWREGVQQQEMFEPARPSYRDWIRWLLRGEYKSFGVRCFGGDPEQARIAMVKVLEAKNGRRFEIGWLDYIAEEMGADGEEAIVRFITDRYGYQMALRKPSREREEERIAHLSATVEAAGRALASASEELAALRRAREAGR